MVSSAWAMVYFTLAVAAFSPSPTVMLAVYVPASFGFPMKVSSPSFV